MPARLALIPWFLVAGITGCENHSGFDDNEFGQDFEDSLSNPLSSMYAQSLTPEGQQLIALMDRLSDEYAKCAAYFTLASEYSASGVQDKAKTAGDLLFIASRAGRGTEMAVQVAAQRRNQYIREITGYYQGVDTDWETIQAEYDLHCTLAVQDVQGTIARLIEQN